jgi:hypothetical protein
MLTVTSIVKQVNVIVPEEKKTDSRTENWYKTQNIELC